MSLQAKCARCQGIFSNFRQTVERNGATYCVQCADAIANGASPRMYDHELITHNVFFEPEDAVAREEASWALGEQVDHTGRAEKSGAEGLARMLAITQPGRHILIVDVGIGTRKRIVLDGIAPSVIAFIHEVQGEMADRARKLLMSNQPGLVNKPGRHLIAFDVLAVDA